MRISVIIFFAIILYSCNSVDKKEEVLQQDNSPKDVLNADLQLIFDTANVKGSVLVFDVKNKVYYSNDFEWGDRGFLPASTFKIPNSIIALETGVVEDDSTLFKWNGEKRRLAVWERDLFFRDAFHTSCVPCYQEIARNVGVERMQKYLKQFQYGNMEVDSSSIDIFWLEGESKISQRQQISFLEKFYKSELGISSRTEEIMKRLIVIEDHENYKLSGKTGWAIRNNNNIGWFVGYYEVKGDVYFFATNIEPGSELNMDYFSSLRREISHKAFKVLGIIN